jgi:hypothetical protein
MRNLEKVSKMIFEKKMGCQQREKVGQNGFEKKKVEKPKMTLSKGKNHIRTSLKKKKVEKPKPLSAKVKTTSEQFTNHFQK